jgi:hypothetical protein
MSKRTTKVNDQKEHTKSAQTKRKITSDSPMSGRYSRKEGSAASNRAGNNSGGGGGRVRK